MFNNFFPENHAAFEIMWKYMVKAETIEDNIIGCTRIAHCITKATHERAHTHTHTHTLRI